MLDWTKHSGCWQVRQPTIRAHWSDGTRFSFSDLFNSPTVIRTSWYHISSSAPRWTAFPVQLPPVIKQFDLTALMTRYFHLVSQRFQALAPVTANAQAWGTSRLCAMRNYVAASSSIASIEETIRHVTPLHESPWCSCRRLKELLLLKCMRLKGDANVHSSYSKGFCQTIPGHVSSFCQRFTLTQRLCRKYAWFETKFG